MKTSQVILLAVALFIAIFIISGYLLSNAFFFKQLNYSNLITTPEEAFKYVNDNIYKTGDRPPIYGLTPKYMLTQRKYLYCDEGSIVLSAMVQELGFETRLVDVIGEDGNAHHTYLEVFQDGEWKTYDWTIKKAGLLHKEILEEYSQANLKGYPRPRTFPRWYNRILQNNFYLQFLSLKLRGIPT